MERYLNTITMLLSIFGGIVVRLLGGLDQLLDVFLFLIIMFLTKLITDCIIPLFQAIFNF